MPAVELVELHGDTVAILELDAEQQLRVELELQEVAAQLLHVLLDHDLDGLPWEGALGKGSAEHSHSVTRPGKQASSWKLLALFLLLHGCGHCLIIFGSRSLCLFVKRCEDGIFCLGLK